MTIDHKLSEIFTVILELSDQVEATQIQKNNEPRWDSLAHASIIAAIESEFSIALDAGDFDRIQSFETTIMLVNEKLQ